MSGLPHIDQIKTHFISGEPGTTGREPFEDSTASGPGQNFTSPIQSGGAHGAHGTGLAGQHDNRGVDHLTAGSGLSKHDNHSSTTGTHGKESLIDKVKDALPGVDGPNDKANKSHGLDSSNTHGTHGLDSTHNTALGHNDHQVGAGTAYGAGKHGTSNTEKVGLGGGMLTGAAGGPATAVNSGEGNRDHGDRVGIMGQDSSKYEGGLNHGPRTGGAAGTDRFDVDRNSSGAVHGSDRQYADGVQQDTSQRAPGEKKGGLSGLLATSDKDFTGRERQGKGAYADTDGPHELNTSGPAGRSALTGREGDLSKNPVAQTKSHGVDNTAHGSTTTGTHGSTTTGTHGSTTTSTQGTHGAAAEPEHKGFLAKVKDAIL